MNSLQYTLPKCQRILFFFLLNLAAPVMNIVADLAPLSPSLPPTTLARRSVLSLTLSLSLPSCEPETTSLCDKFGERGPPFLVVRLRKTNKRCVDWGGIEQKRSKDHKNLKRKSLSLTTNTPRLVACGCLVQRPHPLLIHFSQ